MKKSDRCGNKTVKLVETQKDLFIDRKTLRDQLHQTVQTEDSSFSLSCYLHTSQSLWIGNRMLEK